MELQIAPELVEKVLVEMLYEQQKQEEIHLSE